MRTITLITAIIIVNVFFLSCSDNKKEETKTGNDRSTEILARGDSIVKKTFDTLRSSLTGNIAKNGIAKTVEFCNVNAYPLTAVYAKDGISIRRSSSKVRNPENAPDSLESAVLAQFESKIVSGDSARDVVIRTNGTYHYFKPIKLQSMCRNCHGEPGKDITQEVMNVIREKYPFDKAVGYTDGQLRGTWHLSFPEN